MIVIGTGGVGAAALYHLTRRGVRAIGLDRFPPGHDRGSSHGGTRMIRLAYHEHLNYVSLLLRAYDLWHELEEVSHKKLFQEVGILVGGLPESEMISGVLRSAAEYQLPVDRLSPLEARSRFPGYCLPDYFCCLFEQRAGYLMVEESVKAHAEAAIRMGAELRSGVTVRGWKPDGQSVMVVTDEEVLRADQLVITAGAWSSDLLSSLNVPLRVLRKPLFWYRTKKPSYRVDLGCPCFLFETLGGIFYGFPQIDEQGLKIAEHTGGEPVEDPLEVDRTMHPAEKLRVEECLAHHMPDVARECTAHAVCMYTMSSDGHFVIGCHPEYPQVVFTAGLSGHGFKFTPVLGEIMADLAIEKKTRHAIQFLSPDRFVL